LSSGTTVPIIAPDGTPGDIPFERMKEAIAAGAKPAVMIKDPKGNLGYVPADRYHEAVKAGGTVVPLEQQDTQHPGFWAAAGDDVLGAVKGAATLGAAAFGNPTAQNDLEQSIGKTIADAPADWQRRKAAGYSLPYRLAAPAVGMIANVPGMEESAKEGDIGGVAGHMIAGQALAASPLVGEKILPPMIRGAAKGGNALIEKAPGVLGAGIGATAGHATGIPGMGELGALLGAGLGRSALGKIRIPGESFGLPNLGSALREIPIAGAAPASVTGEALKSIKPKPIAPPIQAKLPAGQYEAPASSMRTPAQLGTGVIEGEYLEEPRQPTRGLLERGPISARGGFEPNQPALPSRASGIQLPEKMPERIQPIIKTTASSPLAPLRTISEPTIDASRTNIGKLLNESVGGKPLAPNEPIFDRSKLSGYTPVKSSALKAYKYDPTTREFEGITNTGAHHITGDISPEQAKAFEESSSKGKAWNELRQNGTPVAKVVNGQRIPVKPPKSLSSASPEDDLTPILQESLKKIRSK